MSGFTGTGMCYIVKAEEKGFKVIPPNEYGYGVKINPIYQGLSVLRIFHSGDWESFQALEDDLTQAVNGLEQRLEKGKKLSFEDIKRELEADTQGKEGKSRYNVAIEVGHKPM